jgi:hypothetical protein
MMGVSWKCARCEGSGEVLASSLPPKDRMGGAFGNCPACGGKGFTDARAYLHDMIASGMAVSIHFPNGLSQRIPPEDFRDK